MTVPDDRTGQDKTARQGSHDSDNLMGWRVGEPPPGVDRAWLRLLDDSVFIKRGPEVVLGARHGVDDPWCEAEDPKGEHLGETIGKTISHWAPHFVPNVDI